MMTDSQSHNMYQSNHPFPLSSGISLSQIELAYETWGTLNEQKDNVVVILHALSGSSHFMTSSKNPNPGWWSTVFDNESFLANGKYFVICANLPGSCYGASGPLSINPDTNTYYLGDFPQITLTDMINAMRLLLRDQFGITQNLTLMGGSMGGMMALEWAVRYPDELAHVIAFAAPGRSFAQTIAFRSVQREAIISDPDWRGGFYEPYTTRIKGLSLARKIGVITYRSNEEFQQRFGRHESDNAIHFAKGRFSVQDYLNHQGEKFLQRFDANSYLILSRAMDLHDVSKEYDDLEQALARVQASVDLIAFNTDILCPPYQIEEVHHTLIRLNKNSRFTLIPSVYGHDAFLLEKERIAQVLEGFRI